MQSFIRILILTLFGLAPMTALQAQGTKPAAAQARGRSDRRLSRFLWQKQRPAKPTNWLEFLKDTRSKRARPSKGIILRHQDGDAWDYVAIEHIGTKATVEMPATPMPASARGLMRMA